METGRDDQAHEQPSAQGAQVDMCQRAARCAEAVEVRECRLGRRDCLSLIEFEGSLLMLRPCVFLSRAARGLCPSSCSEMMSGNVAAAERSVRRRWKSDDGCAVVDGDQKAGRS